MIRCMNYEVLFVSNTEDDMHCMQAAYLMILKYFKPELELSWEDWSKVTGYEDGKATWASASLLWFKDHGFDVMHISLFDYDDFIKNGPEYLLRAFGPEAGGWQVENSNIKIELTRAKQLINNGLIKQAEPKTKDIKKFLDDGYLVRVLVNARKLAGKEGYFGHAVAVIGYDENGFIIHDPGLPPLPNRHLKFADFEAAWADPNKEAKELDAIRPQQK